MKKTNKIFSVILSILMVISIIPISASAEEPTSGTCGDNLTWEFDENKGTLIISGTGEMYRYDCYFNASNDEVDDRPWWSYTSKIKNIIINEGVTTISEKAFYDFRYLFFVTIPSSITHIEYNAFYSWDGIMAVNYLGSVEKWNNVDIGYGNADLYNSEKFYFKDDYVPVSDSGTCGDNLTWTFDANTFTLTFFGTGDMKGFSGNDTMLSEPNLFNGKRPWEDYEFAVKHVVISDGITSIGKNAFAMFINLESIEIPDNVTKIGFYSFGYCINLTDVYYSGSKDEWNSIKMGDMFGSFNTPLDIATIHYNSAGPHTHNYETVVTPATCTEQGYTTYTCECGDGYVADYVDALGHTPANAVEENHVAPTCTENGSKDVVVYCSVCDEEISRETVTLDATGHTDNDGDGYCDADNELLDPSVECEHMCHTDGIMGIIWQIINVLNMLFGLNNVCECDVAHY